MEYLERVAAVLKLVNSFDDIQEDLKEVEEEAKDKLNSFVESLSAEYVEWITFCCMCSLEEIYPTTTPELRKLFKEMDRSYYAFIRAGRANK